MHYTFVLMQHIPLSCFTPPFGFLSPLASDWYGGAPYLLMLAPFGGVGGAWLPVW